MFEAGGLGMGVESIGENQEVQMRISWHEECQCLLEESSSGIYTIS